MVPMAGRARIPAAILLSVLFKCKSQNILLAVLISKIIHYIVILYYLLLIERVAATCLCSLISSCSVTSLLWPNLQITDFRGSRVGWTWWEAPYAKRLCLNDSRVTGLWLWDKNTSDFGEVRMHCQSNMGKLFLITIFCFVQICSRSVNVTVMGKYSFRTVI